jgi:acetyltransferase-like isoleucine patch superfamily enzyme
MEYGSGNESVVRIGAVVLRDVPAGVVAVGIPVWVIRRIVVGSSENIGG